MGVYIDMEIPTTCEKCNLESFCDKWIEARKMCGKLKFGVKATIRHSECPLIPIPAHGKLIDADALYESCALDTNIDVMASAKRINEYMQLKIDEAPTIIPATNKE